MAFAETVSDLDAIIVRIGELPRLLREETARAAAAENSRDALQRRAETLEERLAASEERLLFLDERVAKLEQLLQCHLQPPARDREPVESSGSPDPVTVDTLPRMSYTPSATPTRSAPVDAASATSGAPTPSGCDCCSAVKRDRFPCSMDPPCGRRLRTARMASRHISSEHGDTEGHMAKKGGCPHTARQG